MKSIKYILLLFFAFQFSGCAYYNTMFNAEKRYDEALKKQKAVKSNALSGDVKKNYNEAIKKCWSLIDIYGDSSKYADDALLLIGKSHFNLYEYPQAERVFEQFILKYNQSNLIPDAKLWLAKSYIELERDDDAFNLLNDMLNTEITSEIAGQAFFITGDLHFKRKNYSDAVENLTKSLKAASDDELLGESYFLIGESYFNLEEYNKAIEQYDRVTDLDVPILKEYDALMQMAECYIHLETYSEAESIYKKMLRDIRFKAQFSTIETRIGNLSEIQNEIDFALDTYYDVIYKYKNEEGVALSAFYLAQLFEFEYSEMDSASAYYAKVRNLKLHDDIDQDAKKRSALLKEYLKIRDQLRKDKKDLYSLARGDSTLEDSLIVEPDSSELIGQNELDTQNNLDFSDPAIPKTEIQDSETDSLKLAPKIPVKNVKKVAVSRTPEQVHESFIKNSFNIAEFFLLKYQDFDSAAFSYWNFIETFPDDSILVPKSYYSLYYIYHEQLQDSVKADSIKNLILDQYTQTSYGIKLGQKVNSETNIEKKDNEISASKISFLEAEQMLFKGNYSEAVSQFTVITNQDSGSVWAQKSMYAIAYIFETYIKDISKAIEAYRLLAEEYPGTEYAKIAKNKFKLPPKEIVEEEQETAPVADSDSLSNTQSIEKQFENTNTSEEIDKITPVPEADIIDK